MTAATETSASNLAFHYIPLRYQGLFFNRDVYVATEAVTSYASNQAGDLEARIDRNELEGFGDAQFTVSGYLIDA